MSIDSTATSIDSNDPAAVLASYAAGPERLAAAVAGLDETTLDAVPPEGGWSIRQIVHHVVDGDDIWKMFIKAALGDSTTPFSLQWYWDLPQETWADRWAYAQRRLEPSLALLAANRRHILQILEAVPDAWQRAVLVRWPHGQEQRVSVGWMVTMQAEHVLHHIETIRAIRRARGHP